MGSIAVDFTRTGGFAGITRTFNLSSNSLTESDGQELTRLIRNARFFDLPAEIRSTDQAADRFQYRITISTDEGIHSVLVDEGAIPEQLRPLVDWLKIASMKSNNPV